MEKSNHNDRNEEITEKSFSNWLEMWYDGSGTIRDLK